MARSVARTKINRFELLHRFAIGGMGEIFLARERGVAGFDRQVVVKLLIPELAEQPDLVTLFIDEARIAANLAHPNIVQIFDFGRDDGAYYLAMEYVPGENLARICSRAAKHPRQPLTRELAVHVVAEMARGLDYAHRARDAEGNPLGIVHRDVSPHNLLLSIHGDVKVMDFGIAKAANALHRTATGVVRGKYGYMSPEQLAGDAVDLTTDIYSAGIVLWELTLMRRLWAGKDDLAVLDQARTGRIPRPTEIDPTYPRDLEEIVMHAVARERTQRTSSAAALAADLRGWLALQGAVIERDALGNVVKELFSEIDHEMLVPPDAEPRTTSLPKSAPTPTISPPTVAEKKAAEVAPAASTAPAARTTRRLAFGVIAVAAVGGGLFSLRSLTTHGMPPAADAPTATLTAPSTNDARPAVPAETQSIGEVRPDAAVAVVVAELGSAADHRKGTPTKSNTRTHAAEPVKLPGSGSAAAVAAPPPTAPTTGWLVVESTPWGTFSLPRQADLTTPRKLELPPGDYPITITFSESGAIIRGTATVIAKATTKCRATTAGLTCGH